MHRRPHTHWKSSNIPVLREEFFLSVSLFIQEKKQKVSNRLNTHTYFTVNGVLIASRNENRRTMWNASREQGGISGRTTQSSATSLSVQRFAGESTGGGSGSGRRCSADTVWDNECAQQKWVDRGESQEKRAGWIKIERREDEKGAPSRLFPMKDLCFSLPVLEADKLPPV